ncbi:MAG TPA: hypothetical protein VMS14_09725 [Ilumatobacteraceae bacterium]|nr:hypothetical protein [Ilumatobacteraceae bacterium]
MRRYLVVAHQTLTSPEVLDTMRVRAGEEETVFHLVVPLHHGEGWTWTEGHDRAVATRRIDEASQQMASAGLTVTGEIGATDSPVNCVDDVLRRDGVEVYDGIIVSTLPVTVSKWLKLDVPSRIQRLTTLPVEHIVGHPADIAV